MSGIARTSARLLLRPPGGPPSGTLTLKKCKIANNHRGSGGGLENPCGSTMILEDCDIYNNISDSDGGGIASSGTLTLNGCEVYAKSALGPPSTNGNGGGIVNPSSGDCRLNGCWVYDSTARNSGGGIFWAGTEPYRDSRTVVEDNLPNDVVPAWTRPPTP